MAWNNMPAHQYDAYERGRPGNPPDSTRAPGPASSAVVLDLGAGTGELTRPLSHRGVIGSPTVPKLSLDGERSLFAMNLGRYP